MMQSTADKVISALQAKGFVYKKGEWVGNHPTKPGSDSGAFNVTIADGEHGAFKYFVPNSGYEDTGSLYKLAEMLGIETPPDNRVQVESTKIAYEDLTDYAKRHYVDVDVFKKAQWADEAIYGEPGITWQARTGKRGRYLKKTDKPFVWIGGGTNCWYGLDRAIQMAYERSLPLILCNGEASVVVAQHYNLPAFSGTGGEGAISEDMKKELDNKWTGKIIIALDCDEAGRSAAQESHEKLGRGVIIDLGLTDKGDLADFCGLHTDKALSAIQRLADAEQEQEQENIDSLVDFVSTRALLSDFSTFINDAPELFGRTVKMPFPSMREAGGFAKIMTTKKVWFIGNVSGGGKTIMSETICDEFNRIGYNVFYIGSEWSQMEFVARQVQRAYRGQPILTYGDYLDYAAGVADIQPQQLTNASYAIREIRSRPGTTYVMKIDTKKIENQPEKSVLPLEDIMTGVGAKIRDLRANNVGVDVIVIDYLSLYDTRGQANNLEEYKAGVFKAYCNSLDVLGISTVQVKKDAEDRVQDKGGMLNQHDLYWVRPDKANLITTMNRVYKPEIEFNPDCDPTKASRPHLDNNGQPEPTPNFAMLVVKNSVGLPFHYAYFHFDYDRLRVVEGLHPDYYFDKFYNCPLHRSMRGNAASNGKATEEAMVNIDLI